MHDHRLVHVGSLSWSLHHYCRCLSLSWRRSRQPRPKARAISLCTSSKAIHPSSRVIWLSQRMITSGKPLERHQQSTIQISSCGMIGSGRCCQGRSAKLWMMSGPTTAAEGAVLILKTWDLENSDNKKGKEKTGLSGNLTLRSLRSSQIGSKLPWHFSHLCVRLGKHAQNQSPLTMIIQTAWRVQSLFYCPTQCFRIAGIMLSWFCSNIATQQAAI